MRSVPPGPLPVAPVTVWGIVRRALAAVLDLIFPWRCGGCDTAGDPWCEDCRADLARLTFPGGAHRADPADHSPACPPTWAACAYDGVVRAAVVATKERGRSDLVRTLAPVLAGAIRAAAQSRVPPPPWAPSPGGLSPVPPPPGAPPDSSPIRTPDGHLGTAGPGWLVVPVPSSRAARRRRGEDPVRLLIRAAMASLGRDETAPHLRWAPALRLRRRVRDQADLDRRDRLVNLDGALEVRRGWRASVAGHRCIIVDDVVTSGATLADAARALRAAGAGAVVAATLAETPPPDPPGRHPPVVTAGG